MADKYNFSSFTILVLDDNQFIRKIVVTMCKSFGFGVVLDAANVEAALAHLRKQTVDIVICDWEMHPIDGNEFVKKVRRDPEFHEIRCVPIIMLTSHTAITRVTAARDAGINEFLAKPISAKTLLGRICNIIDNPVPFVETDTYFGPDRSRRKPAAGDIPTAADGAAPTAAKASPAANTAPTPAAAASSVPA